jgi:hypothetical protein
MLWEFFARGGGAPWEFTSAGAAPPAPPGTQLFEAVQARGMGHLYETQTFAGTSPPVTPVVTIRAGSWIRYRTI